MLEKIKAFWGTVKDVILYILAPIAALVAYILYLKGKNAELSDKLQSAQYAGKEKELEDEQATTDGVAASAIDEYTKLRDSYLQGSDPGLRPGDSGATKADPDPGSKT